MAPVPVSQPNISQPCQDAFQTLSTTIADRHFNRNDADIIIECCLVTSSLQQDTVIGKRELRVHRRILAAESTFFQSMVETAGDQDAQPMSDLPRVSMDEDLTVVNVLLGAAYNLPDVQASFTTSRDWTFILQVWEAANKDGMHLLRAFASTLLMFVLLPRNTLFSAMSSCADYLACFPSLNESTIDDDGALKLYSRAAMFDDTVLADCFLERAARKPPHKLSIEILRETPAGALSTLVSSTVHLHRSSGVLHKNWYSYVPDAETQ